MAVNGVVPVVSPLLLVFLLLAVAGAAMLVCALLVRNLRLITRQRLNPFSAEGLQKAGNRQLSTRPTGAPPFFATPYARIATALVTIGASGTVFFVLWQMFTG